MRRFAWLLGLTVLVALGSDKALTGTARTIGGGDRWQFRLRLSASEPIIQREPTHPEWGEVLSIPTFGLAPLGEAGRAGAAGTTPLPVKVVRVAIPEGAEVSLQILRATRQFLKGVRLGSGKADGRGRPDAGTGPTAAPEAGEADASSTPRIPPSREWKGAEPYVRLGQVGYFRFQKFVEVVYTPVVPEPGDTQAGAGQPVDLSFYPEIEVEVVVDGVDPELLSVRAEPAPEDPHFEDSYRAAFVNHDEGRRFRLRRAGMKSEVSTLAAASTPQTISPFAGATTPVYRLIVKSDGIYRLTWSYLLDPTTGVAPGLAGASPADFKLTNKGVEVPIRVVDGGNGSFDPGDYVEFYGEGMLGEPELVLNYHYDPNVQPGFSDILQANDFTDENVYFLFGETGVRSRIPDLTATYSGGALETAFLDTIHREIDNAFIPNGVHDPFYQTPAGFVDANAFNPDPNAPNCGYPNTNGVQSLPSYLGPGTDPNFISTSCPACDLDLPPADPNSAGFSATVRARMRGASADRNVAPDHLTVLQVGTASPTTRYSAMCWDNEDVVTQAVSVPQSALAGGAGVYIGMPGLTTTASFEAYYLDWIEVDYRRALRLDANSLLAHFPNAARSYQMGGFPSAAPADLVVYDISRAVGTTGVRSPRRISGGTVLADPGGGLMMRFTLPADSGIGPADQQRFAAAGPGGFATPVRVTEVIDPDDLAAAANEADMIVIAGQGVVDLAPGSAFMTYLAHRQAESGLSVRLVAMRDIYDVFSSGIETPEAIRSFLAYAFDNWTGPSGTAAPPSYVMLVGDSSADYKNFLGLSSWANQVPTFVLYQPSPILDYYASDNHLAAFRGGDPLPDVHLGRVSVRSAAESEPVFQKMYDYDVSPPVDSWRSRGLLLSSKGNNCVEELDFHATQTGLADTYFGSPFTNDLLLHRAAGCPDTGITDPNVWGDQYRMKADAGAALTSYLGHGDFTTWGTTGVDLVDPGLVSLLAPAHKPTFLLNENCLAGGFHAVGGDSLGEVYQKAPDKGAIAVFAPAGLSFAFVGANINNALYPDLFGLMKVRRFGNLMTDVRLALAFSVPDLMAYTFLGDPAQRLILPAPRPPVGFSAVSGLDAQVLLTWSPGPDPGVLTRIYRTSLSEPNGTYRLLNPAGASGTSYVDATVINGEAYFYRAVSLDPNGPFEGAVTNLNSTCAFFDPNASGPDCVWAVPVNPNPPSPPSNFRVTNPGFGNTLTVSWIRSPEPDVREYTLWYGTTSGSLTVPRAFPSSSTGGDVRGLTAGTTYYFAVTATNNSGRTSAFTPERAGIPSLFDGTNPPDFIADLQVRRSTSAPDSVELFWTPPPTDIYGGPASLSSFHIYRGIIPDFGPSGAGLLATITNPAAGSYLDPGAYVAPPSFYYLIGAQDERGFSSGLGYQLPAGVSDLRIERSAGNLILSWSPVLVDLDGMPTPISHYELYADGQPVPRVRLDSLTPLVPFIPGTSVTIPEPAASPTYYSVIVVDARGNRSPF